MIKKRYSLKDQRQVTVTTERVFRRLDDTVVLFSSSPWQSVMLNQFYPPDRGLYRFRISAYAFQTDQPITFHVKAGPMNAAFAWTVSPDGPSTARGRCCGR